MILLDADISFCMVCKLWYISIRCIFKNLALKLRIYNFRGVCVCICPPHLPSPYTKLLSLLSLYYSTFPTIQAVLGVFAIVFASYFSPLFLQLLVSFYVYSFALYIALSPWDNISIVFKNESMSLQRAIYDSFLRAILIPNYTYFHP